MLGRRQDDVWKTSRKTSFVSPNAVDFERVEVPKLLNHQ